ncbi:MAG: hypothetical protein LOD85_10655 [Clostridia bacterium]
MQSQSGKTVSVWITQELDDELLARGENRSRTLSRDLWRLYGLYRRALRRVALSREEAVLICRVVRETAFDPGMMLGLPSAVEDMARADRVEGVDGMALAEKLRRLDDAALLAVIDAAERALRMGGDLREAVVKVGLAQG